MTRPSHAVAVIGGATAGAEVARRLAERGVEVTVFDMNARPYGKIEDGLPRWHRALRAKEYASIGERLSHPSVRFVPKTKIGRDVAFAELANEWGFSAVVLACGAWRDRPLPIEGAEAFVGRGLIYQNPFIIAFNHAEDPTYSGPRFPILDGAIVLGGGLASLDVAKLLMLETVRARLQLDMDVEELEKRGVVAVLAEHQSSLEALGIKGCTLFYRRRAEDMPLMEMPEGATPERAAKVEQSRKHILNKAREKFGFGFEPLAIPERLVVEDGQLVGLVFRRARVDGKKLIPTDELFERRGSCVISSIGSIPEPMPGVKMKGELFPFSDLDLGRMEEFPNVFSAGNVVTGKGNIIASRKHAAHVADDMIEKYLGVAEPDVEDRRIERAVGPMGEVAAEIAAKLRLLPPISELRLEELRARVKARQAAVGYGGDYAAWIAEVTPAGHA